MTNLFELLQKYNPLAEPASMTDIAFDTGVIAERQRVIKLIESEITRTSGGVFDAKSVLAKLVVTINEQIK